MRYKYQQLQYGQLRLLQILRDRSLALVVLDIQIYRHKIRHTSGLPDILDTGLTGATAHLHIYPNLYSPLARLLIIMIMVRSVDFILDIDECTGDTHNYSRNNSTSTNTEGSFNCSCKQGFTGNGHKCEGRILEKLYLYRMFDISCSSFLRSKYDCGSLLFKQSLCLTELHPNQS